MPVKASKIVSKKPLSDQLAGGEGSALSRYLRKAVGTERIPYALYYELATALFGDLPGGAGYLLRRRAYGGLLGGMGRGVILGRGIALRHPLRIRLGDRVAIDDHCLLDAGDGAIALGAGVIVSRNCVIQGKGGPVVIGGRTDIGCNTVITSAGGVALGASVLVAANCYIGGGRYVADRPELPIMDRGVGSRGPVVVGEGSWIGAGAVVLDGVRIGRGCIVGAGAVVTRDLPDYAVALGVPAAVVRFRDERGRRA